MVAERLFGWSSQEGSSSSQRGQPASGPPQTHTGAHWHQHSGAAGSREAMADADSTEVVYKIRQWSLPGATIAPVLNVSSRVFWLELDDKALLDSYAVLQEGILCDMFSQKCGRVLVGKGLRLPSCCRAVKMQMTGSISCCPMAHFLQPGVLSRRRSLNKSFVRNGAGCKPSTWGWRSSCVGGCLLTACTLWPPQGSHVNFWIARLSPPSAGPPPPLQPQLLYPTFPHSACIFAVSPP